MSDHPVDQLAAFRFETVANDMADILPGTGYAIGVLEPGDMTRYVVAVVRDSGDRYWFANSFGPLYPWARTGHTDWGYVLSHYLSEPERGSAQWTARVLARFLNALAERMRD